MPPLRAARALVPGAVAAALFIACTSAPQPFPGSGPGGKPMRTATETAVGLPPAASPRVYPFTARGPLTPATPAADPLRWLENLDAPEVAQWIKAQNALSRAHLAGLPARAWFKGRITELSGSERYELPVRRGGRYFYLHNNGAQNQSALMVSDSLNAPGRVLFDPNIMRGDATVTLTDFVPAAQGTVLAYATQQAGEDWQQWRFRRIADGTDLPDTLRFARISRLSWAPDDAGVYYTGYPAPGGGGPGEGGRPGVYFHRLGAAVSADQLLYAPDPRATNVPLAQLSEDGHYLVVSLLGPDGGQGIDLIDLERPGAQPAHVFAVTGALNAYAGIHERELYFRSTQQAPLGRIIAVDARDPASRRVVVPEGDSVLEEVTYVGGRLIARYRKDAHSVVRVFARDGRPQGEVPLPGLGSVAGFAGGEGDAETFFSYTDYLTPAEILRLDAAGKESPWHAAAAPPALAAFVTEQVFYYGKDGTRVPLYVTHRRDMVRDGNQPLVLYGGGASGTLTPLYRPQVQAWLELGGVYAEADLHAGEYPGAGAHAAPENQQHVLGDFVAAAEYLAGEHYTRSSRLGMYGRRGGSALIAAAVIARPELFGAALPAADAAEPVRVRPPSAVAAQGASVYPYPLVQSVRRSCYPAMLITTSERDELIAPWHSYRLAAALQAAQSCGNAVFLETRTGHDAGKPVWMRIDNLSDDWAFMASGLGVSTPAEAGAPAAR